MTKEQIKETAFKKPHEATKEELQAFFGIFSFLIKEYSLSEHKLIFEIHFRRRYLIRVEYPVGTGLMSFNNEFVDFKEGTHGISMPKVKNCGELIKLFVNMFYSNLLEDTGYDCYYDEEHSPYRSPEEHQEHLEYLQSILETITGE